MRISDWSSDVCSSDLIFRAREAIMRSLVFAVLLLGGCATTPAGLQSTRVEATVSSSKSSADFATCVAEHLMGDAELRSSGDHYWVLRSVFGVPRHRWDFTPSDSGSVAELRSTGLAGAGQDKVRDCA